MVLSGRDMRIQIQMMQGKTRVPSQKLDLADGFVNTFLSAMKAFLSTSILSPISISEREAREPAGKVKMSDPSLVHMGDLS